ncbi:hypothetical protein P376_2404 [Streptomyces sp. HCCB10043]|nr:hypothetical protein P376_2404 [Streptomyces sp. HCCB10043]
MAAVDQDRELHRAGAADVAERVEGGADRAAGEEHVVDQDDQAALDPLAGDVGAGQGARRAQPQVVAVHGDVERSDRRLPAGDLFEFVGEPTGEEHAPGRDAEQHHVVGALGAFDDLVGDTGQHTGDVGGLENGARRVAGVVVLCVHKKRTSFSASRDGSLKDVEFASSTLPGLAPGPGPTPREVPVRTIRLDASK